MVVVEREREKAIKGREKKMVAAAFRREVSMKRQRCILFPCLFLCALSPLPFGFPRVEGNIRSSSIRKRAALSWLEEETKKGGNQNQLFPCSLWPPSQKKQGTFFFSFPKKIYLFPF